MLKRALPLLLLLGFSAVGLSQNPSQQPPQRGFTLQQDNPNPADAEKRRQSEEELQRLITSRDAMTKEIQRLRQITGRHQQVLVSVKVYELSLNKARKAELDVEGVDLKTLGAGGLAAAMEAGLLDEPGQAVNANGGHRGNEALHIRVLEHDETFKKIIAELKQAGTLEVLAEPTLVTLSGRPASFHSGGEFPIPVSQPKGDTAIEFKEFGTQLDIVPVVLGNDRIRLDVRPQISEIEPALGVMLGDLMVPGFRSRGVNTQVEMNAGQTLVLAGLVQQRKAREESDAGDKDNQPETGPDANEMEETELIVIVRAEIMESLWLK
ncbi:MAG: hypothetical protein WDZ51_10660 [Pirellulaceae bacterium]